MGSLMSSEQQAGRRQSECAGTMNADYVRVLLDNDVSKNERYYIMRGTASVKLLRQLFKAASQSLLKMAVLMLLFFFFFIL